MSDVSDYNYCALRCQSAELHAAAAGLAHRNAAAAAVAMTADLDAVKQERGRLTPAHHAPPHPRGLGTHDRRDAERGGASKEMDRCVVVRFVLTKRFSLVFSGKRDCFGCLVFTRYIKWKTRLLWLFVR